MHGVFLSCRGYSVSSPRLQFRRACGGDSAQIVTPFVQVGTYPTRNFAQELRTSPYGLDHIFVSYCRIRDGWRMASEDSEARVVQLTITRTPRTD